MSLEAVKEYFGQYHLDERIVTLEDSTATVEEAALAHHVDPDQIAKTLSFKLDDQPILVVVAGNSKIDNKKYKEQFSKKAKMLKPDEVVTQTGHVIGGVCPFGLKNEMNIYLDVSLKKYPEVIPAAGDPHSAIRLSLGELERYSNYQSWVDVCK
ncbi:YbaK/EbsC family protein [Celerinatantimonas sp. MCCC 1A17872]|uniref:YbaK/EbsC family protein n=1 Tax=Celerinatantimonas sp. MCCC 1A17872 TaxID=3177514 RepID=UPI0038C3F2C6